MAVLPPNQSPTSADADEHADDFTPAFIDRLLTDHQVAELVGLKRSTLQVERYCGGSRIPFVRVGGAVRYRMSDVQAFIASLPAVRLTRELGANDDEPA